MSKLVRVLLGAALITASSIGVVNAQMAGTKHDLRSNPGTLPTGQGQDLCRFCHSPHNSSATAPLWDRNASDTSGSFILYGVGSSTMENTPAQPTGVSNGCLSCHDGVTAFDSLIGVTGTVGNDMNTLYAGSAAIIGADLSNDHPIAVSVTTANEMEAPATIIAGGVPLFGGGDQVECASCHDPHLTTYTYFLRLDPAAGTLCETCHTK
jgi:predicted CXXCH cytochrome family protein